jgi:hypothetical protein
VNSSRNLDLRRWRDDRNPEGARVTSREEMRVAVAVATNNFSLGVDIPFSIQKAVDWPPFELPADFRAEHFIITPK